MSKIDEFNSHHGKRIRYMEIFFSSHDEVTHWQPLPVAFGATHE